MLHYSDIRSADSTKDYFIPQFNKSLVLKNKHLKRNYLKHLIHILQAQTVSGTNSAQ